MAEEEGELTYEGISEIRRKEENSSYLSQIRTDFYTAANHLVRKNMDARNKILIENPDLYDGISSRYRNVSTLLERVIFIRTNKIWLNALRDASAGTPQIPENLTAEERDLYMTLYNSAKRQFVAVNGGRIAFTQNIDSEYTAKGGRAETDTVIAETVSVSPPAAEPADGPLPEDGSAEDIYRAPAVPPMDDVVLTDEEAIIRVLDDIPKFSGPERDYTLKKEDVVRLPSMMASALINRRKAVLVKTAP